MFLSEKFAETHLFSPEKTVNTKLSVCDIRNNHGLKNCSFIMDECKLTPDGYDCSDGVAL